METMEPANDIPIREPPACEEDVHRLSSPVDEVRYGSLGGFTLTASENAVVPGNPMTFRLENTTEAGRVTGNKRKHDIQRRVDGEWRSIYWVKSEMYNALGVHQPPGNGFQWTFTVSRDGLEQSRQSNTSYSVCDAIVPGDYRFVYWGVSRHEERESDYETEYAVGARFTVVRS